MRAATAAVSAICGTHLGWTKLPISISRTPAPTRRSISSIFWSTLRIASSFCRPSRGPTSKIRAFSEFTRNSGEDSGAKEILRPQPKLFIPEFWCQPRMMEFGENAHIRGDAPYIENVDDKMWNNQVDLLLLGRDLRHLFAH